MASRSINVWVPMLGVEGQQYAAPGEFAWCVQVCECLPSDLAHTHVLAAAASNLHALFACCTRQKRSIFRNSMPGSSSAGASASGGAAPGPAAPTRQRSASGPRHRRLAMAGNPAPAMAAARRIIPNTTQQVRCLCNKPSHALAWSRGRPVPCRLSWQARWHRPRQGSGSARSAGHQVAGHSTAAARHVTASWAAAAPVAAVAAPASRPGGCRVWQRRPQQTVLLPLREAALWHGLRHQQQQQRQPAAVAAPCQLLGHGHAWGSSCRHSASARQRLRVPQTRRSCCTNSRCTSCMPRCSCSGSCHWTGQPRARP